MLSGNRPTGLSNLIGYPLADELYLGPQYDLLEAKTWLEHCPTKVGSGE